MVTCESLIVEHLVAEVVRLDPVVVSSCLSLVLGNEKGHNSQHNNKHSKGCEDDASNSIQASFSLFEPDAKNNFLNNKIKG